MTVAETIIQQMGGSKFESMVGVKGWVTSDNSATCHFPIQYRKSKINNVSVTLMPNDTYTMRFYHVRGTKIDKVEEINNLFGNQLQSAFTQVTGLETKL